ncbi:MAG: GNAT family N-acetyltransferase [Brevinematales bacterium]|nr:GNAT family N-acetyltransferase [Brevinematales bacterium]
MWKQFIELHADLDPREAKIPHAEDVFREMLRERFSGRDSRVLVAVVENEITGFMMIKIERDDPVFPDPVFGFVEIIAVSEKGKRHGIGEILYRNAVSWFRERGASNKNFSSSRKIYRPHPSGKKWASLPIWSFSIKRSNKDSLRLR